MIALLTGVVAHGDGESIILDVQGVGYALSVPARDSSELLVGTEATLFVAENIREDAYELYGFRTMAERALYYRLISVNGVGPRMAHGILSVYDAETLTAIIDAEDLVRLSQVSGVGKKTAQRMVLELKGKLVATGTSGSQQDPAGLALMQLGYSVVQADQALAGIDASLETSERVRQALKGLSR